MSKLDSNNIESGIWLPVDLRHYVDSARYVHKYGMFARALKASKTILNN